MQLTLADHTGRRKECRPPLLSSLGGILLAALTLVGCGQVVEVNPLHLPSAAASTWQRRGTVLAGTAAEEYSVQEPTVLYEGSSILFPGTSSVFKMWHTCGWLRGSVCYAESRDGLQFTRFAEGQPILTGVGRPFVMHMDGKYYLYATPEVGGQGWNRYESQDGVSWSLTAYQTLTTGEASWNRLASGNIFVWKEGTLWYAMYEGLGTDKSWRMGLATSQDGMVWSRNPSNPVIAFPYCGGPEIHKVGATYYMWGQCNQFPSPSTEIYRLHSTDLLTWTPDLIELARATLDEGTSAGDGGQVADPTMVEANGMVYLYYDATPTQQPTSRSAIHLKVATTEMSLKELAAAN